MIFLHVIGIYVLSFFTGSLIARFGLVRVMTAGALFLMAAVAVALGGLDAWNFRISLTLNGVGSNFLFIGTTALVTTCYRPSERGEAQSLNDFPIFGRPGAAADQDAGLHRLRGGASATHARGDLTSRSAPSAGAPHRPSPALPARPGRACRTPWRCGRPPGTARRSRRAGPCGRARRGHGRSGRGRAA